MVDGSGSTLGWFSTSMLIGRSSGPVQSTKATPPSLATPFEKCPSWCGCAGNRVSLTLNEAHPHSHPPVTTRCGIDSRTMSDSARSIVARATSTSCSQVVSGRSKERIVPDMEWVGKS